LMEATSRAEYISIDWLQEMLQPFAR